MGELSLFRYSNGSAEEMAGRSSALERPLQLLIEQHLEAFLGVRFLETEYSTGKLHGGRIDTLGIDEDGSPVIIEYKRSTDENVVSQGLYYLDWLTDHHGDFEILVRDKIGSEAAAQIDWKNPRLICVAAEYTKFDTYAVQQIDRNISLFRYRQYGEDMILFELINATTSSKSQSGAVSASGGQKSTAGADKPFTETLAGADPTVRDWFADLREYVLALGEDVQEKSTKLYVAFKRVRNFCCVVAQSQRLMLYLSVDPSTVELVPGFTRDVSQIGHWATGELEITVDSADDLVKAKELIGRVYETA